MTDNAIRNEIGGAVAQLLFESAHLAACLLKFLSPALDLGVVLRQHVLLLDFSSTPLLTLGFDPLSHRRAQLATSTCPFFLQVAP